MDTKKAAMKGSFNDLLNRINVKDGEEKLKKGTNSLVQFSKNVTSNLSKSIENKPQQISDIIKSLKNEKIKNLEKLLRVDKSELIASNKKNRIYRSESGSMYIVDKNIWGEPVNVTIKDDKKLVIKCIKYLNDQPFLFPVFNEKNLKGKIINMTMEEIWYQDADMITVVSFNGESADFVKIKITNIKNMTDDKLFDYINNFKLVYKNKKINDIITEKGIKIDDVLIVRKGYIIGKDPKNNLKSYVLSEDCKVIDEIPLRSVPKMDMAALDTLFSSELVDYIKSNNYDYSNFKQNGEYIEYWQTLGSKNICVVRYKI